jgi:hypothetical protein
MTARKWLTLGALPALLLASLLLPGCTNPFSPRIAPRLGFSEPPPVPNGPKEVLRLFAWCWNHRAYAEYTEIFTDDFRFFFALGDTAGNFYRDRPVDRETELRIARNLFLGGGSEPPANKIVLNIDPTLHENDDSRPGKDPGWHREIITSIDLEINTDSENFRVTGQARFFVVRGDSALIPQEMKNKGFGPDPNRWYIEQYDDETFAGAPSTGANAPRTGAGGIRFVPTSVVRRPRATNATWSSATLGEVHYAFDYQRPRGR